MREKAPAAESGPQMSEPRSLLHRLLDYIGEQAKDIDPRGFRLSAVKGFICRPADIAGLPGIETDLKVTGDHIWLRIQRLVASKPHAVSENFKGLIHVSDDPNGPLPVADEAAFLHRLHKATEGKPVEERKDLMVCRAGEGRRGLHCALAIMGRGGSGLGAKQSHFSSSPVRNSYSWSVPASSSRSSNDFSDSDPDALIGHLSRLTCL